MRRTYITGSGDCFMAKPGEEYAIAHRRALAEAVPDREGQYRARSPGRVEEAFSSWLLRISLAHYEMVREFVNGRGTDPGTFVGPIHSISI